MKSGALGLDAIETIPKHLHRPFPKAAAWTQVAAILLVDETDHKHRGNHLICNFHGVLRQRVGWQWHAPHSVFVMLPVIDFPFLGFFQDALLSGAS